MSEYAKTSNGQFVTMARVEAVIFVIVEKLSFAGAEGVDEEQIRWLAQEQLGNREHGDFIMRKLVEKGAVWTGGRIYRPNA
jgi:hypothetical protein